MSRHPTARLVPLPTGTDMEVLHVPDPPQQPTDRPALIFIHGSLHAAWTYQFFQPYFADAHFQTYSISMRGAGASQQQQTTSTSIAQHVEDLSALINLLPNKRFVLVAHSLGGFVAQKLAQTITDPSRIAALVLLASTPPTGNNALILRTVRRLGLRQSFRITMGFARKTVMKDLSVCRDMFFSSQNASYFNPTIEGDDVLKDYMTRFSTNSLSVDMTTLKDLVRPRDDHISFPTLAVCGSEDIIVDEQGAREAAEMWGGDFVLVDGAPHDLMLYSEWQRPAAIVRDWLNAQFPAKT